MKNGNEVLKEFLDKLYQIEKELDNLEDSAYTLSQLFNRQVFPEQEKLSSDILENLIITATHEVASQIGFCRNDIEILAKFIEFREKHVKFTDKELSEILDGVLSIESKAILVKRFPTTKDMLANINQVKHEWHQMFNNMGYSKLKKRLRLDGE